MKSVARILLFFCLVVAGLMAFAKRHINEDLFLGFRSGRDTLNGLLGRPDQWSFTTDGSVWVDQSWLSHLLYYLSYVTLDDLGPVCIKAVLLVTCLLVMYLRCRALKVTPEVALLALTLGCLSLAPFLAIRAENFGMLYFVVLTAFLTAPECWGRRRQWGALVTLALWSNGHGSFMFGFGLLGVKLALEALWRVGFTEKALIRLSGVHQNPGNEEMPAADVSGWLVAFVASAVVVALANPYGIDNLMMPFRQLSARAVTTVSMDWLSLPQSLRQYGFLSDVLPFIGMVAVMAGAATATVAVHGFKGAVAGLFSGEKRNSILMECIIVTLMIVLAFRFRRLILFSSMACVPLCGALLQPAVESVRARGASDARSDTSEPSKSPLPPFSKGGVSGDCLTYLEAHRSDNPRVWFGVAAAALGSLLVLGHLFFSYFVVRYLPGNPMRPDKPIVSRIMSFPGYTMEVARFMTRNGLGGRVFSGWSISDFLLFYNPNVQVFMDCRDQSAYTDDVIQAYFRILYSRPSQTAMVSGLLEEYGVSFVLVDAATTDTDLAVRLMKTRKWACIYKDEEALLLARADLERLQPLFATADLKQLWYGRPETRIVSEAMLSLFMHGTISPGLVAELQSVVRALPDPYVYSLITFGLGKGAHCLDEATKSFLESEIGRLSKTDFMVANGAGILDSQIRILSMLDADERKCPQPQGAGHFAVIKKERESLLGELRKKYY